MREMTDGAFELLSIAGQIARSRSAQQCSTTDLALAAVVYRRVLVERRIDIEDIEPDSGSPEMLPMAPPLEERLVGRDAETLDVGELIDLAARHNPDLADYLR
ncbi:hypothetical protein ACFYYR_07165 [Streptomyces sp. NPDC001922]|uniref:hypothetical protein n=1 Tax=Streptomyces sp. NPDC001922 TaxID=3364624 RepID=UPI0036B330F1